MNNIDTRLNSIRFEKIQMYLHYVKCKTIINKQEIENKKRKLFSSLEKKRRKLKIVKVVGFT